MTDIDLGSNYLSEVVQSFNPRLSDGSEPRNSGAVIPNVTDGFTGAAPDRGAVITGRPVVVWGDRIAGEVKTPMPPSNLTTEM